MEDDDDDLNTSMSSGIYACTPSLMALQQMKNRLHMAYLGKRLMKWTVLATSRDLRRIAMDISVAHETLLEDVREALVKVARCRYFYSQLNVMALENHPELARLTVSRISKSVAGCKFRSFEVLDCGEEIYMHFGIDKGGQLITDTKLVWLKLIKRLIENLSLRISFKYLEAYTKVATKKMNILSKIVIPKTLNTIKYIILELEERSREDFFRLKKVVDIKRKRKARTETELNQKCPICYSIVRGDLAEGKCDCLKTEEYCEVEKDEKMPICSEKLKPETKNLEVISDEQEDYTDEVVFPKSEFSVEKSKESTTDLVNHETDSDEEKNLQPGNCEGPCVGETVPKISPTPKMPIYDHKRRFSIDKDETVCDGPCTDGVTSNIETKSSVDSKNQHINAKPKRVQIDSKVDFKHEDTVDATNLPSCTCSESKNFQPRTPCGTPELSPDDYEVSSIENVRGTPVSTTVKKYTKTRRYQDCDGTLKEEIITITIQTDSYEPESDSVRGNNSETDDDDCSNGCCSFSKKSKASKSFCHRTSTSNRTPSSIYGQGNVSSDDEAEFTCGPTRVYECDDTSGDSSAQ